MFKGSFFFVVTRRFSENVQSYTKYYPSARLGESSVILYVTTDYNLASTKASNFSNCSSLDKFELSNSIASSAITKGESSRVVSK